GQNRGDRYIWGHRSGFDRDRGKFLDDGARFRVDQPHDAVAAGRGQDLAVGAERDGVDTALRYLDAGDLLHSGLVISLDRSVLLARSAGDDFLLDRLDIVRIGRVELVRVDSDLARRAIKTASGGDPLAIGADCNAVDAPRHRRELANQVRIVTDHAHRL